MRGLWHTSGPSGPGDLAGKPRSGAPGACTTARSASQEFMVTVRSRLKAFRIPNRAWFPCPQGCPRTVCHHHLRSSARSVPLAWSSVAFGHGLVRQGEVEDLRVLIDPLAVGRLGEGRKTALQAPAQQHLGGCPPRTLRDPVDRHVGEVPVGARGGWSRPKRERTWPLVSAHAEGSRFVSWPRPLDCHPRGCTSSWPMPIWMSSTRRWVSCGRRAGRRRRSGLRGGRRARRPLLPPSRSQSLAQTCPLCPFVSRPGFALQDHARSCSGRRAACIGTAVADSVVQAWQICAQRRAVIACAELMRR